MDAQSKTNTGMCSSRVGKDAERTRAFKFTLESKHQPSRMFGWSGSNRAFIDDCCSSVAALQGAQRQGCYEGK